MLQENVSLKKQLVELLGQHEGGLVEEQEMVVDAFLSEEKHFTVHDLQQFIHSREVRELPIGVIMRTLEILESYGIAKSLEIDGREYFEHKHLGKHHDHVSCSRCGKIEEIQDPELEVLKLRLARDCGFEVFSHSLVMNGLCEKCLPKLGAIFSLSKAQVGARVKIAAFGGGRDLLKKVHDIGLKIGDEIEMIASHGNVVVACGEKRLALGVGVATKIQVEMIEQIASSEMSITTLDELKEGERGSIVRLRGHGPLKRRLQEMGFVKGVIVMVKCFAPLQDPVDYKIKDFDISLRITEAREIQVERIHEGGLDE